MFYLIPIVLGLSDQILKQIFFDNQQWQISIGQSIKLFLNYYANPVAAFSLPLPAALMAILSVAIVIALLVIFFRTKSASVRLSLVFILIGAASNLADRLRLGFVIDYLGMGILNFRSSLFNLADLMILAGLIIWLKGLKAGDK